MEKTALKHLIYGGFKEIIYDSKFYYHSTVGESYSHLTEDGVNAVSDFLNSIAYKIYQSEKEDLENRAKELTLRTLKS